VELAEMTNRSVNQFLRIFRQATQMSPMEYLIRLRVLKAVRLLPQDTLTVTDVAYRVGFNDSNYFSKQFKRFIGVTPYSYRQHMQHITSYPATKIEEGNSHTS
jgi:AraC family L-rhamnose operon transcriptional activator RhaR/AraC family L-rhamnose operon regulatory protein RhaS